MEYTKLGATGLDVSRICLGGMSYGAPTRGPHPWTLDLAEARPLINAALEAGINFFDTANVYSDGTSEEILGLVLAESARRDEIVIATKVNGRMQPGPNGAGLSRKAILAEIDNSLRRLRTDYLDLYQIHRWDQSTPIAETLEVLNDLVRAGKVRYLGASSMFAWQFSKALHNADRNGWSRFVTMQNHYNLLYREEEREMLPLCADEHVGVLPWSPLARGRLTRDWDIRTERADSDEMGRGLYHEDDRKIVEALSSVAEARGIPRAQVALAWVASRPSVVAPIVGVTRRQHLDDALAALAVTLTDDELGILEKPYSPHPVRGIA